MDEKNPDNKDDISECSQSSASSKNDDTDNDGNQNVTYDETQWTVSGISRIIYDAKRSYKDCYYGENAREKGINLHAAIKCYYENQCVIPDRYKYKEIDIPFKQFLNDNQNDIPFDQFLRFEKDRKKWNWEQVCPDYRVTCVKPRIRGNINMLFKDPNDPEGRIIVDWTRSRKDFTEPGSKDRITIQLNTYKYFYEQQKGEITQMFLVQFNPEGGNYTKYEIAVYPTQEIEDYINYCLVIA